MNEYEDKINEIFSKNRRVSPPLLMRNLQMTYDMAFAVCQRKWLERWKEARVFMREYEDGLAR